MRGLQPILSALIKIINTFISTLMPIVDIIAQFAIPIIDLLSVALEVLFAILNPIFDILVKIEVMFMKLYRSIFQVIVNALEPLIEKLEMVWDWIRKILKLDNKKVLDVEVNRSINDTLTTATTSKTLQEQEWMRNIITNNESTLSNISNVKNYTDNSVKNFNINLTIQNFGEELDYDEVVRQINLRLAEQF